MMPMILLRAVTGIVVQLGQVASDPTLITGLKAADVVAMALAALGYSNVRRQGRSSHDAFVKFKDKEFSAFRDTTFADFKRESNERMLRIEQDIGRIATTVARIDERTSGRMQSRYRDET